MLEELVRDKTFFDDLTDRETRIQAGVRILEDDLQVLSETAHFRIGQTCEVDAVVAHRFILIELRIARVLRLDRIQFRLNAVDLGVHLREFFVGLLELFFDACLLALERFDLAGLRIVDRILEMLEVDLLRLAAVRNDLALFILVVDFQHEAERFRIVLRKETADDLDDVAQMGLLLASCDVAFLQQVGVRMVLAACLIDLLLPFDRLLMRLLESCAVLTDVADRVAHILRRQLVDGGAVIQRAARRLRIELQQNAAERRLSAAGFADDTERFALVNVDRDVLVRTNVKTLLLEDGGLRNREVLFQISD